MLSKVQSTVMLLVTFAYGVFNVWGIVNGVPPQQLVEAVVQAIFALLGFVWAGKKAYEAYKYDLDSEKIQRLAA